MYLNNFKELDASVTEPFIDYGLYPYTLDSASVQVIVLLFYICTVYVHYINSIYIVYVHYINSICTVVRTITSEPVSCQINGCI